LDFYGHLEILRRGVLLVLLVFALGFAGAFFFMEDIMPFFTSSAARMGLKLYVLGPLEKFYAYLKVSALCGGAVALPFGLWSAAAFVAPALAARSRKSLGMGIGILFLFIVSGVLLAWMALVPFAVGFLSSFASGDGILPMWSLDSFVSLATGLIVAMALLCLVPPVLLVLMRAGILGVRTLAKARRYVIVAIAILAGVITPTVDVVSQCIVGACMWGLFEVTLILGRLFTPRRSGRVAVMEASNEPA